MAAVGVLPEDIAGDAEVWPDNMEAALVFSELVTQWRYGMAGITGLDYTAIWTPIRIRRIPRDRWQDLFESVRTMERAVLEMKAEQDGQR